MTTGRTDAPTASSPVAHTWRAAALTGTCVVCSTGCCRDGESWAILRETLCSAESSRAVLNWLRRGGAELLTQLASCEQPPSHEILDGLGPVKRVVFLRGVLTVAGLLEERSEHIARFDRWVDQRTADLSR